MEFSLNAQNGSCVLIGFETSDPQNSGSGLTHTSLPPVFKYYTAQTQKPITTGHSFSRYFKITKAHPHSYRHAQRHKHTHYFRDQATAIQNGRTHTKQKARGGAYHLHS